MQIGDFHFPDNCWYYPQRDMWAMDRGNGIFRVGITSLGVRLSGEFFLCRPKPLGTHLLQGDSLAVVEVHKAAMTVKTPLSGTVIAINQQLHGEPERIHQSPYEDGWIADIHSSVNDPTPEALVCGEAALVAMQLRLKQEGLL